MTFTAETISDMGFGIDDLKTKDELMFYASLEWLNENTDYGEISLDSPESAVKALPPSAKVFIVRYIKMLKNGGLSGSNVSSESIGGMSKSYSSAADSESALCILAMQLLGHHYLGGRVTLSPDVSRYVYGR